ncbi:MAG: HigA family addiction module antitoxin [Gemmatimonadota bacterium]|nr:HigA family addiction module antitoxin [Gemmatimonadota bacterium]
MVTASARGLKALHERRTARRAASRASGYRTNEESFMAMHDPPHPGGIVRRQCLEPLGLTVTRAAEGLGVTRQALSELLNGRTGVSVEMAIRLSKAFGSTPETWLGMQMAYDLWEARGRAGEIAVERFAVV